MAEGELDKRIRETIATSDAIRYAHMGNPETIVIGDLHDVAKAMLAANAEDEDGLRLSRASELAQQLAAAAVAPDDAVSHG